MLIITIHINKINIFLWTLLKKRPNPKTSKRFAVYTSSRREYGGKMCIKCTFLYEVMYRNISMYCTHLFTRNVKRMAIRLGDHRRGRLPYTKFLKFRSSLFKGLAGYGAAAPRISLNKKRKAYGNPTRRSPTRPIALYRVF